jgi:FMN phosphatase YigB (HAD superfamily)
MKRPLDKLAQAPMFRGTKVWEDTNMKAQFRRTGFSPSSPQCIVFDMDDVLCNYDPKVTLRDAQSFTPRADMVRLAKSAKKYGLDVVVATARKSFHQWKTWRWLEAHGLEVNAVYHRAGGTNQTSSEAKRDMLQHIQKTWEIVCFYDDSPHNVRVARELGIQAIQIPGNEAFWAQRGDT